MERNTALSEAPPPGPRLSLAIGPSAALAAILLSQVWLSRGSQPGFLATPRWGAVLPLLLLAACSLAWLGLVTAIVPEPYLDEVFHIPQAQSYCAGRFRDWDDKITTPPGLYILTILVPHAAHAVGLSDAVVCDAQTLRAANVVGLLALTYLAFLCRSQVEARLHEEHSPTQPAPARSQYALHTALNIGLFPLLFFFSGLYYTDVASTAVVLAAYLHHLSRVGPGGASLASDGLTVLLGAAALLMRQTNVFWVVVYIGGLEAVHAVKTLRPERVDQPFMATLWEQLSFYAWRYSLGEVHDPPLHDMWPEDMLFTALSLLVAAACNTRRVLRQIWPHMAILFSFAAFVAWNGGVVLGDKSNHIATLHLAQMLYIWPLFAFFSLPLLLPYAVPPLNVAIRIARALSAALSRNLAWLRPRDSARATPVQPTTSSGEARSEPSSEPSSWSSKGGSSKAGDRRRRAGRRPSWRATYDARVAQMSTPLRFLHALSNATILTWPAYLVATALLSLAVVRLNTIVHPFTLADNRHYMFYVFRLTIRRGPRLRYLLVLPYCLARWAVWGTAAGCSALLCYSHGDLCSAHYTRRRDTPFRSNPLWVALTDAKQQPRGEHPDPSSPPPGDDAAARRRRAAEEAHARDPLRSSSEPAPTSTGLVLLLATALSLVSAPLVEPRYFILPWVLWRLLVPAWRAHDHDAELARLVARKPWAARLLRLLRRYDGRLAVETAWFVAVNAVTGYVFLCRPYVWRAEDGTVLDGGRLQRFMW